MERAQLAQEGRGAPAVAADPDGVGPLARVEREAHVPDLVGEVMDQGQGELLALGQGRQETGEPGLLRSFSVAAWGIGEQGSLEPFEWFHGGFSSSVSRLRNQCTVESPEPRAGVLPRIASVYVRPLLPGSAARFSQRTCLVEGSMDRPFDGRDLARERGTLLAVDDERGLVRDRSAPCATASHSPVVVRSESGRRERDEDERGVIRDRIRSRLDARDAHAVAAVDGDDLAVRDDLAVHEDVGWFVGLAVELEQRAGLQAAEVAERQATAAELHRSGG